MDKGTASQCCGMTGSPIRRRTIGPTSSRLGEGLAKVGLYLAHRALATPCGGPGACRLTSSSVEQCFLRHIGAAGFRIKAGGCKEARFGGSCFGRHMTQTLPHEPIRELQR